MFFSFLPYSFFFFSAFQPFFLSHFLFFFSNVLHISNCFCLSLFRPFFFFQVFQLSLLVFLLALLVLYPSLMSDLYERGYSCRFQFFVSYLRLPCCSILVLCPPLHSFFLSFHSSLLPFCFFLLPRPLLIFCLSFILLGLHPSAGSNQCFFLAITVPLTIVQDII